MHLIITDCENRHMLKYIQLELFSATWYRFKVSNYDNHKTDLHDSVMAYLVVGISLLYIILWFMFSCNHIQDKFRKKISGLVRYFLGRQFCIQCMNIELSTGYVPEKSSVSQKKRDKALTVPGIFLPTVCIVNVFKPLDNFTKGNFLIQHLFKTYTV